MIFLIYTMGFVALLFALEGGFSLLRRASTPTRVRDRLRRIAPQTAGASSDGGSMLRSQAQHLGLEWGSLKLLLYRAGAPMTVTRFVILSALLGGGLFLAAAWMTDSVRAVPALLAGGLPWITVSRKARARMREFEEQLPDALELLTRSLKAGHALGSGFQMVGDELADPIATEFGLVAEEIRLGLEIREALENLGHRVDNSDLPYFTTAVLIQRQTGGNLAELLDKLGNLLRERQQFGGRVRALTAQGRGAATFLALWMPAIVALIWMVAPGYLAPLIENTWGHFVLGGAFLIDGFAYIIALRIADVQA